MINFRETQSTHTAGVVAVVVAEADVPGGTLELAGRTPNGEDPVRAVDPVVCLGITP